MDRPLPPADRVVAPLGARIALVAAEVVRPLRQSVLRPGRPPEESVYDGDDHPLATHVALVAGGGGAPVGAVGAVGEVGAVLAVGSLFPEDPPAWLAQAARAGPAPPSGGTTGWWRIRGMATAQGFRRRGLGRAVLDELLAGVAGRGGGSVWCNARVPAVPFYARAGFLPVGEVFKVPVIGAHLAMWRAVAAGWDTDDPEQDSEDPPRSQGAVHA